jgi:hypothetical protein
MRYFLKLWKDDMGTFTQPGCRDAEDALWCVNSAREHDGLCPLTLEELNDALASPGSNTFRAELIPQN